MERAKGAHRILLPWHFRLETGEAIGTARKKLAKGAGWASLPSSRPDRGGTDG